MEIMCDGPYGTLVSRLRELCRRNGAYEVTGNPGLADGNWHHFVFASDSTNFFDWFDGVRDLGAQNGLQGRSKAQFSLIGKTESRT